MTKWYVAKPLVGQGKASFFKCERQIFSTDFRCFCLTRRNTFLRCSRRGVNMTACCSTTMKLSSMPTAYRCYKTGSTGSKQLFMNQALHGIAAKLPCCSVWGLLVHRRSFPQKHDTFTGDHKLQTTQIRKVKQTKQTSQPAGNKSKTPDGCQKVLN